MKRIVILGATGSLGSHIIEALEKLDDVRLTLFVRNRLKLSEGQRERHRVVEGDVMNDEEVRRAVAGQDIVYFGLSGELAVMAGKVIKAMNETEVKRIIAISSMGIYGASWRATLCGKKESPGLLASAMLTLMRPMFRQHRKLADMVESSGLNYTILRPGRFTDEDEVAYQITYKGQPEAGRDISRKSIADCVRQVVKEPEKYAYQNIGLTKGV